MKRLRLSRDSLPTWVLALAAAVSGPLLLFHYGSYHWFHRDDWEFLAKDHGVQDLLQPHGGSHLVAVPRLVYLGLWELFGLRSYRAYQVPVVLIHVAISVLLFVVMRRARVSPWLASAAATMFALVGPGALNAIWAFQVGFNGSLAWGLAHLLLADHRGPRDRRDLLGLVCGLVAVGSSGVGVSLTVAVAVAVLINRGLRMALFHSLPLVVYGAWVVAAGADTSGPLGRPPPDVIWQWTRASAGATFTAIGYFTWLTLLFTAMLGIGLALLWRSPAGASANPRRSALSLPIGLAAGALAFVATTALGRAGLGYGSADSERYVYLQAAMTLPLLAVACQAIADRWRILRVVVPVLFLVPVPFNLTHFDQGTFNANVMARRKFLLTTVVRMPFAHDVPSDVQPAPDPAASDAVSIGFLLAAERDGDLVPSTVPLTPEVVNEFRVRLGVAQRFGDRVVGGCRTYQRRLEIEPDVGDQIYLGSRARIGTQSGGVSTSRSVTFDPQQNGAELTIELPDLHLRILPARDADTFRLCDRG